MILLEGCVLILWKIVEKVLEVVEVLGLIVYCLKVFGLIDKIVNELLGGVYCDLKGMVMMFKCVLVELLC